MKSKNFKTFLLVVLALSVLFGHLFGNYLEDKQILKYKNLEKEITYKKEKINKKKSENEDIKIENSKIKESINNYLNKSIKEAEYLIEYEKINGNRDAIGPGVEIVLSDGEMDKNTPYEDLERYLKVVHNMDMLNLLNDLKLNGAESIEINGERLIDTSEVYCSFAFISINDKKIPAPFKINIIGNTEKLRKYMEKPFNLIDNFRVRGLKIEYEFKDEINLKGSIPYIDINE